MDSYDLSPSAQAILSLLEKKGDLSSSQIISQMEFSARTVRYALKSLLNKNLVKKKSLIYDMRYTKYSLSSNGAQLARTYYKYVGSIPISKTKSIQDLSRQNNTQQSR
ncbi:MAG: winged helix-turn-helix transcriptional regulator [Candidatus Hermodarchaeota archaeon]